MVLFLKIGNSNALLKNFNEFLLFCETLNKIVKIKDSNI